MAQRTLPRPNDLGTLAALLSDASEKPTELHFSTQLQPLIVELQRAQKAREELEAGFLVVGILGGTGVGKSTLLNALAGEAISQAGDRRPTTERAVCYRHQGDPIPEGLPIADLAEGTPTHERDELRGVTLIDLPDLDSHARGHRDVVHRVLQHLDLLLIVSNTEKYSDAILYEEIRNFPQAPRNMLFVLNAIDRVSEEEQALIENDFRLKLEQQLSLTAPHLLATCAVKPHPRGSLDPLRDHLQLLGGESARRQVLLANFEARLDHCNEEWNALWGEGALPNFVAEARQLATPPKQSARLTDALRGRLENLVAPWARDRAQRASWFPIGPAYFIVRKIRRRGWVEDPLRSEKDPLAEYTEECLLRPLRLAQTRFEQAQHSHRALFKVDLPEVQPGQQLHASLESWLDRLGKRVPKLAWKLRQHVIPVTLAVASLGHIIVTVIPDEDRGAFSTLWQSVQQFLLALNPTLWVAIGVGLLIYYAAVYPYFCYRLERALHLESEKGAQLYQENWRAQFEAQWTLPLNTSLDTLETWWKQVEQLADRIGLQKSPRRPPQGSSPGSPQGLRTMERRA